jgi:spore germination cell wall hydrolase CwlJ-like protein
MSASLAPRLLNAAGILELTLWGEAGHRPVRAVEGIAAVVMNRARLAGLADGPQHLGRGVAGICRAPFQFACWHPKHPRHRPMQSEAVQADPAFAVCRRIAARALAGALPDGTGGATHYHGVERLPRWAIGLVPVAERGGVVFYRLLG